MRTRATRYLMAGMGLVWIVGPKRQVDLWHLGDGSPTTLGVDDALDGENVVPGFTYPVGALFA